MDRKLEVVLRQLSLLDRLWVDARDDAEKLWIVRQWDECMALLEPCQI
jgi:hypothetical protein